MLSMWVLKQESHRDSNVFKGKKKGSTRNFLFVIYAVLRNCSGDE